MTLGIRVGRWGGGNEEGWVSLVVVHDFHFTRSLLSPTALDSSLVQTNFEGAERNDSG